MINYFSFVSGQLGTLWAVLCVLVFYAHAAYPGDDVVFYEDFSGLYSDTRLGKDKNSQYNDKQFIWQSEVRAKIIDYDSARMLVGMSGIKPILNPKIDKFVGSNRSGDCVYCALRFFYPKGNDSFSEQRFKLNPRVLKSKGVKGLVEIWLQYDIYIPDNYYHRDLNPESRNRFGGGEKLLSLFADDYSAPNPTLILGLNMMRDTKQSPPYPSNGNSYQQGTFSYNSKDGVRKYVFLRPNNKDPIPVIDREVDLGSWQRRTLRVKMPKSEKSNDGVIQLWIRRQNGSVVNIIDIHDGDFYGYHQNYINGGYLQGWSNSGFDNDTNFVIDNVIITNNVKYIDSTAIRSERRPGAPKIEYY